MSDDAMTETNSRIMIAHALPVLECLLLVSLTLPCVIAGTVAVDDGAAHAGVAAQPGVQGVRPDPVYSRTWLEERPFHISTICVLNSGPPGCTRLRNAIRDRLWQAAQFSL